MVKEIKKYVTTDGQEFDEKWKATSYEEVSEIVSQISNIFGERGSFSSYFKKIIKKRKELGEYLLSIEEFDERGIDLFFGKI